MKSISEQTPTIGHDYIPYWIDVAFNVETIKNGQVYGTFYTGHKRHFPLATFLTDFTHDDECISCPTQKELKP